MATPSCRRCRGATYRVLIVDDHPRARDMLSTTISFDDERLDVYSICEAASGEEAAQRARVYKPHVVPMDIKMPGIDGFEAAKRIKEERPSTVVVMVTAVPEPGQREEASKIDAAGFLSKFRVATDLVSLLSEVLSQPSAGG